MADQDFDGGKDFDWGVGCSGHNVHRFRNMDLEERDAVLHGHERVMSLLSCRILGIGPKWYFRWECDGDTGTTKIDIRDCRGEWFALVVHALDDYDSIGRAALREMEKFYALWGGEKRIPFSTSDVKGWVSARPENEITDVSVGVDEIYRHVYVECESPVFEDGEFKIVFKGPMTEERGRAIKDFFSRDLSSGKVTEECQ